MKNGGDIGPVQGIDACMAHGSVCRLQSAWWRVWNPERRVQGAEYTVQPVYRVHVTAGCKVQYLKTSKAGSTIYTECN